MLLCVSCLPKRDRIPQKIRGTTRARARPAVTSDYSCLISMLSMRARGRETGRRNEEAPRAGAGLPFMCGGGEPVSGILSGTAIYLGRSLPNASSGLPGPSRAPWRGSGGRVQSRRLGGPPVRSCLSLHRVGFARPPRRRGAGALLPHHFTLAGSTCRLRGRELGRYVFCCTFRGVAPPGC